MVDIHLGFYSYSSDLAAPRDNFLYLTDLFTGPFSHVVIYLQRDSASLTWAINLSKKTHMVVYGKMTVRATGYGFMRLKITKAQYVKLTETVKTIIAHPTHFDRWQAYGVRSFPRCTVEQEGWFCSQLVGFLLVEIGVLDPRINPSKLSVTNLYLLCRRAGGIGVDCPFLGNSPNTSADFIYLNGMKRTEFPLIDERYTYQFF